MVLLPETIPFLAELMEGEHVHTHTHTRTYTFVQLSLWGSLKVKEPKIRFKHLGIQ